MKASLIISVYKNIPFLKTVLDSLKFRQRKDLKLSSRKMERIVPCANLLHSILLNSPISIFVRKTGDGKKTGVSTMPYGRHKQRGLFLLMGIVFFMKDSWKCIYALQMRELCWRENV